MKMTVYRGFFSEKMDTMTEENEKKKHKCEEENVQMEEQNDSQR